MFIEHNSWAYFLAKKVAQKKISTKIANEHTITEAELTILTQKEVQYIFNNKEYQTFEKLIHNQFILKDVVLQSKLSLNTIEMMKMLHTQWNPLKGGTHLYRKGDFLQWWLTHQFPIEFIYHSNHLEGSKIPKEELEKIIQEKKYTYKVKNEIQEVNNSIKTWNFLQEGFIWNIANIKKLYHILTKDLLQENGNPYPRGFKKIPIVVNNVSTVYPEQVEQEIKKLINTLKQQKNLLFPLQLAFDVHLRYEQIHPFENGNGRTGRLLMNKILIQNEMLPMVVFKENKKAYFNAIKNASESQHWKKAYYSFMIEQYKKSLNLLADGVK